MGSSVTVISDDAWAQAFGQTATDAAPGPEQCPHCRHCPTTPVRMKLPSFTMAEFETCSHCTWSSAPREATPGR